METCPAPKCVSGVFPERSNDSEEFPVQTKEEILAEMTSEEQAAIQQLLARGWEISWRPWLEDADDDSFVGRATVALCKVPIE